MRVLVAEDETALGRLIEINLTLHGYEVGWVKDGEAALAAVSQQRPDVIILDVGMPKLDGFEVLRELKGNPDTADIPVVMLTGRSDDDSVLRGWSEGVHYYMTKPFDPADLMLVIERVLAEEV